MTGDELPPSLPLDWAPDHRRDRATGVDGRPGDRQSPTPEPGPAGPVQPGPVQPGPVQPEPMVEVLTSKRRQKTATAFWREGRIVVVLPAHVAERDRAELIEWLVSRVRRKRPGVGSSDEALARRAGELADRYVEGVRPNSIRWVTNQQKRWGSCSPHSAEIRLSERLQAVPGWVLDAIIVHELAHLVHADHSPGFHALADRYPRHRDAALFLDGFQLGLDGAT